MSKNSAESTVEVDKVEDLMFPTAKREEQNPTDILKHFIHCSVICQMFCIIE